MMWSWKRSRLTTLVGGAPSLTSERKQSAPRRVHCTSRVSFFPNSNIIFNLQLKDPSNPPKTDRVIIPFDYVEWGATVYPGWLAVDQAAVATGLAMGAAILLLILGTQILNWYWPVLLFVTGLAVGIWRIKRLAPSAYVLAQKIDRRIGS